MQYRSTITDKKGAKRHAHLLVVKGEISLWISRYSSKFGDCFFYAKVDISIMLHLKVITLILFNESSDYFFDFMKIWYYQCYEILHE